MYIFNKYMVCKCMCIYIYIRANIHIYIYIYILLYCLYMFAIFCHCFPKFLPRFQTGFPVGTKGRAGLKASACTTKSCDTPLPNFTEKQPSSIFQQDSLESNRESIFTHQQHQNKTPRIVIPNIQAYIYIYIYMSVSVYLDFGA